MKLRINWDYLIRKKWPLPLAVFVVVFILAKLGWQWVLATGLAGVVLFVIAAAHGRWYFQGGNAAIYAGSCFRERLDWSVGLCWDRRADPREGEHRFERELSVAWGWVPDYRHLDRRPWRDPMASIVGPQWADSAAWTGEPRQTTLRRHLVPLRFVVRWHYMRPRAYRWETVLDPRPRFHYSIMHVDPAKAIPAYSVVTKVRVDDQGRTWIDEIAPIPPQAYEGFSQRVKDWLATSEVSPEGLALMKRYSVKAPGESVIARLMREEAAKVAELADKGLERRRAERIAAALQREGFKLEGSLSLPNRPLIPTKPAGFCAGQPQGLPDPSPEAALARHLDRQAMHHRRRDPGANGGGEA